MILFTDHSPGLGITQVQASAGLAELGQPMYPTLDSPETLEVWQALSRGLGGNQGRKPSLGGKALRTYLQWFRLFCAKSMRARMRAPSLDLRPPLLVPDPALEPANDLASLL